MEEEILEEHIVTQANMQAQKIILKEKGAIFQKHLMHIITKEMTAY